MIFSARHVFRKARSVKNSLMLRHSLQTEKGDMAKIIRLDRSVEPDGALEKTTACFASKLVKNQQQNGMVKHANLLGAGDCAVDEACRSLQGNHVIAVPTDTIYGVAGLAQSTEAVDKIYKIKSRSSTNPVAICVGDVEEISRWANVTIEEALLHELLPGPVTVIFERTAELNPKLNPETNLVGLRIPDHDFIRALARQCRGPLALTSANVSGSQSTLSVEEFTCLWPQLGVIIDGGVLGNTPQARLGSTVVDLSQPGAFSIRRPGSAMEETCAKLRKYGLVEVPKT